MKHSPNELSEFRAFLQCWYDSRRQQEAYSSSTRILRDHREDAAKEILFQNQKFVSLAELILDAHPIAAWLCAKCLEELLAKTSITRADLRDLNDKSVFDDTRDRASFLLQSADEHLTDDDRIKLRLARASYPTVLVNPALVLAMLFNHPRAQQAAALDPAKSDGANMKLGCAIIAVPIILGLVLGLLGVVFGIIIDLAIGLIAAMIGPAKDVEDLSKKIHEAYNAFSSWLRDHSIKEPFPFPMTKAEACSIAEQFAPLFEKAQQEAQNRVHEIDSARALIAEEIEQAVAHLGG